MTNDRRRRTKEMKKIDGYWIDENGNRWNDCSKERAKELSSSMINCYNCRNCHNCHYCHNCGQKLRLPKEEKQNEKN